MKCKSNHFFFCFHPKFDTGTWSIAIAFTTAVMFSAMLVMTVSYSAPKCACPQIWEHIDILPTTFKIIYILLILFFMSLVGVSGMVIYGSFKARHRLFPPYLIMMIATEIGTFGMSIFILIQIAHMDQYLLFDNDTYWNMAKMVLKPSIISQIELLMSNFDTFLMSVLQVDMAESLNLDKLMDATLKEGVLVVLGGMKRLMKLSAVLMLLGINTLFVTSVMVVGSHYRRLKSGKVRTYTGVPGMLIHKIAMTSSARSTATESLSDDWSGTPMRVIRDMRSKDYKRRATHGGGEGRRATRRSERRKHAAAVVDDKSSRIYDVERLSVEEKFPRGEFL